MKPLTRSIFLLYWTTKQSNCSLMEPFVDPYHFVGSVCGGSECGIWMPATTLYSFEVAAESSFNFMWPCSWNRHGVLCCHAVFCCRLVASQYFVVKTRTSARELPHLTHSKVSCSCKMKRKTTAIRVWCTGILLEEIKVPPWKKSWTPGDLKLQTQAEQSRPFAMDYALCAHFGDRL